jgi:ParB family transcriptional regulator, chromosome partitioning protein
MSTTGTTASAVITARMLVPVTELTAHPGNVRINLNLTPGYVASLAEGILVPLRITPRDDGGYWVIDGARRLAGAIEAGLTEVPCDVVPDRAGDLAGQYLDMVTTSEQRTSLRPAEVAAALFAAHEAGAPRARLRRATGLGAADVTSALTAARLSERSRALAESAEAELTLRELAVLAEFDDDEAAVARLTRAVRDRRFDHEAELIRGERTGTAERARLREELAAAGYQVSDRMPDGAMWLSHLCHDGSQLTEQAHATCPGRGAAFPYPTMAVANHFCADPLANGHVSQLRPLPPAGNGPADPGSGSAGAGDGETGARERELRARRLVLAGNRAWDAAGTVRHRWLLSLLTRQAAPPPVLRWITGQLLAMPAPLSTELPQARSRDELFREVTGASPQQLSEACQNAKPARLALLQFAVIAVAYEYAITHGDAGRSTWREDRYTTRPREQAGRYLAFLGSLGYPLSGIEQAVADGIAWTGDEPAGTEPGGDTADVLRGGDGEATGLVAGGIGALGAT